MPRKWPRARRRGVGAGLGGVRAAREASEKGMPDLHPESRQRRLVQESENSKALGRTGHRLLWPVAARSTKRRLGDRRQKAIVCSTHAAAARDRINLGSKKD